MDSSSSQCGDLGTATDVQTQPQRQIEKKTLTRETRFNVSLLVLVTLALGQLVLQSLEPHFGIIAHIAIIALAAFSYEWILVHSSSLTRHRRAFFDVSNVLETYQTRARTMGHLFVKEPDTPGVVQFAAGTVDNEDDGKKAQFNKARDSHYANEFERAMKAAKEMESHESSNKSSSSPAGGNRSDISVEPNMTEEEEKIKKEIEKYGFLYYYTKDSELVGQSQPNKSVEKMEAKSTVKNVDMSEEMQADAIDMATRALEKYNVEKDIAAHIKKEFDKKYTPTWHCIVGRNFGSYVTHETKHFIYFYVGQVAILLFKSG